MAISETFFQQCPILSGGNLAGSHRSQIDSSWNASDPDAAGLAGKRRNKDPSKPITTVCVLVRCRRSVSEFYADVTNNGELCLLDNFLKTSRVSRMRLLDLQIIEWLYAYLPIA